MFYNDENRSHDTYRSFTQRWFHCVQFFFIFGLNSFCCCCCCCWYLFVSLFCLVSNETIDIARGVMMSRFLPLLLLGQLSPILYKYLSALHFFFITLYNCDNKRCTCYSEQCGSSCVWAVPFNLWEEAMFWDCFFFPQSVSSLLFLFGSRCIFMFIQRSTSKRGRHIYACFLNTHT